MHKAQAFKRLCSSWRFVGTLKTEWATRSASTFQLIIVAHGIVAIVRSRAQWRNERSRSRHSTGAVSSRLSLVKCNGRTIEFSEMKKKNEIHNSLVELHCASIGIGIEWFWMNNAEFTIDWIECRRYAIMISGPQKQFFLSSIFNFQFQFFTRCWRVTVDACSHHENDQKKMNGFAGNSRDLNSEQRIE